ncbi:low molecular weight phosphatase family protein [Sinomonas susongensis]|uniref:arsenate reductase/protein-tyrosine-phosphatase family protein n=1 Tax=Sinomonas susongensis TaxID=1324851 RepID=UPI003CCC75CB
MVCSGNLCRSPIAEQLLRARMNGYAVRVHSAGVIAEDGARMPQEAATVSRRYGGDPSGHRSRLLTEAQLRESDLVLTATRAQRSAVVRLLPRMSRRTFTIREFSRLVRALLDHDAESHRDPAGLVDAVRSLRGFVTPPEDPSEDDLEDPYRRQIEVYEAVGASLHLCIETIVVALSRIVPLSRPSDVKDVGAKARDAADCPQSLQFELP